MKWNKYISIGLSAFIGIPLLSGCGITRNPGDIPLVQALSQKEVADYYKQSMDYETIATRSVKPERVTYELTEVTGNIAKSVCAGVKEIEDILSKNSVPAGGEVSPEIFEYIKYILDDKKLTEGEVVNVSEGLGHYFVDKKYRVTAAARGTFKEAVKYLGINGAFAKDAAGNTYVDTNFMTSANNAVYGYLKENSDYRSGKSTVAGIRAPLTDVTLFNRAAGMSLTQTAIMPPLDMIYEKAAGDGLSGYGIYPQGGFTLRDFGYARSDMEGEAILRYVFKKDIMDGSSLEFTNVYVMEYKLDESCLPETDEGTVIPEFVVTEAAKAVERSDRAICNNDITALMSSDIYDDMGVAVLNGNMRNYCNKQRHMSNLGDVMGRKDHKYLMRYETMVQEGPKGTYTSGTYVENGFLVIQQEGAEFHITDYLTTERKMTKEPQLDLESTILKRLAALNLAGEVTEEAKEGIGELLQKLYSTSTERKLEGMYECFNTDTNLLTTSHREYLNAQLRGWLTKHGTKTKSTYEGAVTQWIGGADNQAEMFTEELIQYENKNTGQYMQNYYLVSNYKDKWVIDEMKVVESKEVTGSEMADIAERISRNNRSKSMEE